ncbi:MAG: transporter substrate-binding domain-containing protein [Clostridiales bacterium]|nr:transporter substrate-binding domain-containing protein [Clostridiales bacterium]
MKKIFALLFAAIMLFAAAGCSGVPANTVFSADDIPGKVVGVQLGTTGDIVYASEYEADGETTVERYTKTNDAVQALKQGKLDCIILDEQPANYYAAANEDLKVIAGDFDPEDYAIAVAKENTELLDQINSALATLKENGTLDNIIANYIGEDDVQGTMPYVSSNTDYSNGQLVMVTEATFPPYEYYEGGDGKIVGIDIDMAQAIADILKMELVVQDIAFDTIVTSVQTGKADIGVAGLTVNEDRLEYVNFSDSYVTATQVLIVRAK